MLARDFCYWLQGLFELSEATTTLDAKQTDLVKRHLALVFKYDIDPSAGGAAIQAALNEIHGGPAVGKPAPAIGGPPGPGSILYRC